MRAVERVKFERHASNVLASKQLLADCRRPHDPSKYREKMSTSTAAELSSPVLNHVQMWRIFMLID